MSRYHGHWLPTERGVYTAIESGVNADDGIGWITIRHSGGRMLKMARTVQPANAVVGDVVFYALPTGPRDVICGSPAAMRLRSGDDFITAAARLQDPHYFVVTGFFTESGGRVPEGPRDRGFVQLVALTSTETDHKLSACEKIEHPRAPPSPNGIRFLAGDSYVFVGPETAQVVHVPAATLAGTWVTDVQVTLPAVQTINGAVVGCLPNDDAREHLYAVHRAQRNSPPPPAATKDAADAGEDDAAS